jgi:P2-related tail formation protein
MIEPATPAPATKSLVDGNSQVKRTLILRALRLRDVRIMVVAVVQVVQVVQGNVGVAEIEMVDSAAITGTGMVGVGTIMMDGEEIVGIGTTDLAEREGIVETEMEGNATTNSLRCG